MHRCMYLRFWMAKIKNSNGFFLNIFNVYIRNLLKFCSVENIFEIKWLEI